MVVSFALKKNYALNSLESLECTKFPYVLYISRSTNCNESCAGFLSNASPQYFSDTLHHFVNNLGVSCEIAQINSQV